MSISIVIGFFLTIKLSKKYQIDSEKIWQLAPYLIFFGFIGARVYHVLSEINYYFFHPLEVFYVWQGGLGIFGAIIAGILVLYFFSRKYQLSFWLLVDILTPALVLGEAIGRWGNWFNQENFGQPTNLAWGIPIDWQNRPIEYLSYEYFQPTFLYQSIWNLFLFLFLFFLIIREPNSGKDKSFKRGYIFSFYLILYSIGRFLIEFLRINYQPMFLGLRLAQIITILMFIIGWLILISKGYLKIVIHK